MQRELDNIGRLTIPKGYRDRLGVKEQDIVNIDMEDNKIIITNPKHNEKVEEIKYLLYKMINYNCEYETKEEILEYIGVVKNYAKEIINLIGEKNE